MICAPKIFTRGLFAWLCLAALSLEATPADAAKCPNVQLVMDRSGSMISPMTTSTGGMDSRWNIAKAQLKSLVSTYDGLSPMGLTIFPRAMGCGGDPPIRPAYGTKAAITMALDAKGPDGSTPTANTLNEVRMLTELRDTSRGQYLIVLTDGAPGCGALDSEVGTVGEVTSARMQSPPIYTYVVGIGNLDASARGTLTRMAEAGGKALMTPLKYYPANTEVELANSLTSIAIAIGSAHVGCTEDAPDGGTPADLSEPGRDMTMSERDMTMSERDMTMSERDMTMSGRDMTMPPDEDLSMPMMDLSVPPGRDLAMGPRDMTMPPQPLDLLGRDLVGTERDSGPVADAPVVDWVTPKELPLGAGGGIEITGRNFVVTLPSSEASLVGDMGVFVLNNALVVDDRHIRATVPMTVPVGVYDVVVRNPTGTTGTLSKGFTITAKAGGCACSLQPATPSPDGRGLGLLLLTTGLLWVRSRRRSARTGQ